jgi:hypothetical protein
MLLSRESIIENRTIDAEARHKNGSHYYGYRVRTRE